MRFVIVGSLGQKKKIKKIIIIKKNPLLQNFQGREFVIIESPEKRSIIVGSLTNAFIVVGFPKKHVCYCRVSRTTCLGWVCARGGMYLFL